MKLIGSLGPDLTKFSVILMLSLGCGDPTGLNASVQGRWFGITPDINRLAFDLQLTDVRGEITGTGSLEWGQLGEYNVTEVAGTRSGSDVALTLTVSEFATATFLFSGTASGGIIDGTLTNVDDEYDVALTLERLDDGG